VQHPAGHRVRGRLPGERLQRERLRARHQHEVAEPPAAQHPRLGDQAYVREHCPRRGYLPASMRQRRPVRHINREHALAAQRPPDGADEFDRGQMGRRAPPVEHVRDHHVEGACPEPLEHVPGVADPDPDPARRQPPPDQVHQRGVDLNGQLRRARPRRGHVPRQRQGPGAQVQHAQRLPRRRRRVNHVAQPPDILEVQVAGVVQVDVRLRDAVDQQHPRGPPVGVPQQLGAAVDALHSVGRGLRRPPS